ncbi:hypothetical protein RB195_010124 [Necator americanus]|uniref:Uncharacterized protein n=1 Tax=Necator americanus TaxID=51031 RepID=A0ABR1CXM7_NECAM
MGLELGWKCPTPVVICSNESMFIAIFVLTRTPTPSAPLLSHVPKNSSSSVLYTAFNGWSGIASVSPMTPYLIIEIFSGPFRYKQDNQKSTSTSLFEEFGRKVGYPVSDGVALSRTHLTVNIRIFRWEAMESVLHSVDYLILLERVVDVLGRVLSLNARTVFVPRNNQKVMLVTSYYVIVAFS